MSENNFYSDAAMQKLIEDVDSAIATGKIELLREFAPILAAQIPNRSKSAITLVNVAEMLIENGIEQINLKPDAQNSEKRARALSDIESGLDMLVHAASFGKALGEIFEPFVSRVMLNLVPTISTLPQTNRFIRATFLLCATEVSSKNHFAEEAVEQLNKLNKSLHKEIWQENSCASANQTSEDGNIGQRLEQTCLRIIKNTDNPSLALSATQTLVAGLAPQENTLRSLGSLNRVVSEMSRNQGSRFNKSVLAECLQSMECFAEKALQTPNIDKETKKRCVETLKFVARNPEGNHRAAHKAATFFVTCGHLAFYPYEREARVKTLMEFFPIVPKKQKYLALNNILECVSSPIGKNGFSQQACVFVTNNTKNPELCLPAAKHMRATIIKGHRHG